MMQKDGSAPRSGPDMPDSMTRLRRELADPPFHSILHPMPERVGPDGSVVIRLAYRPEFSGRQGANFFHGGVIAALVDLAAHAVVALHKGQMAPTVDLRVDYLRPAQSEYLLASARVLKLGNSISRTDVEVQNADGQVVAVGRGAFDTRIKAEISPQTL